MLIEICATNIQSALIAEKAGAHRIELCVGLDVGGLTPSIGLVEVTCRLLHIPVYVLIRPREGNFTYTEAELDSMVADIRHCEQAGAAGVVIGALDENRQLHRAHMAQMKAAAGNLDVTCHRAFDFVADPFAAIDMLVDLGIRRVLSSGQAPTAPEGAERLAALVQYAGDRLTVMPGAGIEETNIRALAQQTKAREFHLTAKRRVGESDVSDGMHRLDWGYWESDEAVIRRIVAN